MQGRPAVTLRKYLRLRSRAAADLAVVGPLLAAIFVLDTATDYEIAVAVFYVAVILLGVSFLSTRGVVILTSACGALTLLSFFLTPSGARGAGLVNLGISIAAIASTAWLALKIVAAEAAVHEARTQLARMARLTSLGALTASIAHEVNQPLAAVAASGDACRRWLDAEPPNLDKARGAADRIVADARRASEIVERVRALARGEAVHKRPIDLNASVAESVALARGEMERRGVSLSMSLADDLPPVQADHVQLQQVIANLILNAIEAMDDIPQGRRAIDILSARDAAGDVVLSVGDAGPGVRADSLDRLFDAFWTTKHGGTGIGLTISRSIVESCGGRIWAFSREPAGAVFQFSLPAAKEGGA